MKGTHWTGLILSIGMGCATKTETESVEWEENGSEVAEAESTGENDGEDENAGNDGSNGEESDDGVDEDIGGLDNGEPEDGGGAEDEGTEDDIGDTDESEELVLPYGLNGTRIDPPTPLVEFYAVNRDGGSRSMADLMDGPTVIWFYPAADTFG